MAIAVVATPSGNETHLVRMENPKAGYVKCAATPPGAWDMFPIAC